MGDRPGPLPVSQGLSSVPRPWAARSVPFPKGTSGSSQPDDQRSANGKVNRAAPQVISWP